MPKSVKQVWDDVTYCGTCKGVLHDPLHLGLDMVLPQAWLRTAGIKVL